MGDTPTVDDLTREIPREDRPPSGSSSTRQPGPARAPKPTITQIEKRLKEVYALGALPIAYKCADCAAHYAANCEAAAESLITLAKTNPKVRAVLETLVQGSTMTEVLVTHGFLIVPMLMHHDLLTLPPFFSGMFGAGMATEHVHTPDADNPMNDDVTPTTAQWIDGTAAGVMPEEPATVPQTTRAGEDGSSFSLD